jgi:hypothetical protein
MATSATFSSGVATVRAQLLPADTTAWKDVYDNSAGTKAVRIEGLGITSDDTSTVNIQFSMLASAVNYLVGTVRAVTLSGTDGAAAKVNALTAIGTLAPDGIYDVWVGAGEKLQAKSLVTVTSAKTVTITGRARLYA